MAMDNDRPEPSASYIKAKRALIFFSGALLLGVWIGLQSSQKNGSTPILPFQLERPEYLPHILAIITAYYFFQLVINWIDQDTIIRQRVIQKIDFFISSVVGIFSIFSFIFVVANPLSHIDSGFFQSTANIVSLLAAIVGAVLAATGSMFAKRLLSVTQSNIEAKLHTTLIGKKWMMHFNPAIPNAKKVITFKDDGLIGEGQNKNENTWKIREGFLEIYNLQSQLQSRFIYNKKNQAFYHTNDKDTLSIPGQTITLIE